MADLVTLQFILLALAMSPKSGVENGELSRKIKNGDHQAFRRFYDSHYDALLRFLISKNTEKEAAEDLIQKAFIYIWEHRHKIDPGKSLRAYIFQIAYTRMLNYHRDHKKFNHGKDLPELETTLTPEDQSRASDLQRSVEEAIKTMPEKRGTVFQLCFMNDFTYKEAARALDVTRKTIENHMGRALKDMRKSLKEFR